ncbi:hypothetical protein [Aromatoleum sp.]|uniref:hypothetical protein n=1 Tax=Aromatoleum sp. TaxID=2307007 RepID=UPI002FCAD6BE
MTLFAPKSRCALRPAALARVAVALTVPLMAGCAAIEQYSGPVAGVAGVASMASELDLLGSEYLAGAAIAYAIYDPLAPTWDIKAVRLDEERVRFDLRMKSLASGGEGEARQVFARNARQFAETEGFAGYDVVRYEEGIESTRPFARRVASGEIRLARSRVWPGL